MYLCQKNERRTVFASVMKRSFYVFSVIVLLLAGCGGQRQSAPEEAGTDSLSDTITDATSPMSTIDSLELLITETPMPRAADQMFDDFIFNFVANKRLQMERIAFPLRETDDSTLVMTEKGDWQMAHLFMKQGYYTLLFNDDRQMALMKDTAVSQAIVEKIHLRRGKVKQYCFHRLRGAWMMTEVRTEQINKNENASFLAFYQRFATDSIFQAESLAPTVSFSGPDPDDDFSSMEGVITVDTWEAFAPTLPSKVLYNIVYGEPQPEGNEKIFLMRGVSNGLELELRFRKRGGQWQLVKMRT